MPTTESLQTPAEARRKAALGERPLLSAAQGRQLAALFKVLGETGYNTYADVNRDSIVNATDKDYATGNRTSNTGQTGYKRPVFPTFKPAAPKGDNAEALVTEAELCVGDLADALAMKTQAVSNQLQRLAARGIVSSRRNGTNIYYRVADPCVPLLLDRGLCLSEDAASSRVSSREPGR